MNIEILEFYPLEYREKNSALTGTLRIKLPDIGIHILGVFVSKRKDSWYFMLPSRNALCHKTGEQVRYPLIVFEDRDRQKELMSAIREKGRIFLEKILADTENPINCPERLKNASVDPKHGKGVNALTLAKETSACESSKSRKTPETKRRDIKGDYVDLPKRASQLR